MDMQKTQETKDIQSANQLVTIFGGHDDLPILNPKKEGAEALIKAMNALHAASGKFFRARNKKSHGAKGNIMGQTRPNLNRALERAKSIIDTLKATGDIEFTAALKRAEQFCTHCHTLSH